MRSPSRDADLTARATIRNVALRLFAERGHEAVTVRDIAAAAKVSPALVLHHFGSKEGLRTEVHQFAGNAFDSLFVELDDENLEQMLAEGGASASVAEAFARAFPPGSPLPAYLRRLLLTNDPAGSALFGRWFTATRRLLDAMAERSGTAPSGDPAVLAAFLLINDLALVLLQNHVAAAIGVDPLSPGGLDRWAREVTPIYAAGVFSAAKES